MSVSRAQQEISSPEFAEWLAFERLDPWGPERWELAAAKLQAQFVNCHRSRGPAARAKDFMPEWGHVPGEQRQTDAEMEGILRQALGHLRSE